MVDEKSIEMTDHEEPPEWVLLPFPEAYDPDRYRIVIERYRENGKYMMRMFTSDNDPFLPFQMLSEAVDVVGKTMTGFVPRDGENHAD